MNLLPRYTKLPISTPKAALALLVLLFVIWSQGGIDSVYQHLFLLIGSYLVWGLLLPFIQGIVERLKWKATSTVIISLLHMVALLLIHFLCSNIIYYALQLIFIENSTLPDSTEISSFILPSIISRFFDFILFFGLLSGINQSKTLTNQKVRLLETEAQLQKSKLDSLRGQLNPHFLFNTMHAISSMIGTRNDKAREITIKISSLLRKTLKANEKSFHSLAEELELINDYLEIESERFGDRLHIEKEVNQKTLDFIVPTMCLQPIIENAFKHGIALIEGKTVLSISVRAAEEFVHISVKNDVSKENKSIIPSNGIGLKNLEERLQLQYQDDYALAYGKTEGCFVVQMKIKSI